MNLYSKSRSKNKFSDRTVLFIVNEPEKDWAETY